MLTEFGLKKVLSNDKKYVVVRGTDVYLKFDEISVEIGKNEVKLVSHGNVVATMKAGYAIAEGFELTLNAFKAVAKLCITNE